VELSVAREDHQGVGILDCRLDVRDQGDLRHREGLLVGHPRIMDRKLAAGLLEQGDELAASVLDTTAHWVALAVVSLQSLLDLERIVFGGSIGVRPELLERVRRALSALYSRPITITPSRLGDRAGLIGAVCAAAHTTQMPEHAAGPR